MALGVQELNGKPLRYGLASIHFSVIQSINGSFSRFVRNYGFLVYIGKSHVKSPSTSVTPTDT